jgi:hypothetical protein
MPEVIDLGVWRKSDASLPYLWSLARKGAKGILGRGATGRMLLRFAWGGEREKDGATGE